jgi:hypothetical protein
MLLLESSTNKLDKKTKYEARIHPLDKDCLSVTRMENETR